jgi:hypothetical protein
MDMSFQRKRSYLCAFLFDRQNKNNQSKETKSTKTYEKDPKKPPKQKQTYKQTHLIKIQRKSKSLLYGKYHYKEQRYVFILTYKNVELMDRPVYKLNISSFCSFIKY